MLVDDDLDILEALEPAIARTYDVVLAHDAAEALEVLGREPIDAVVLDLMMPGMDTAEFMRQRAERKLVAPVIAASARPDIARRCTEVGIDRWVQKPFRLPELFAHLRACVGET